MAPLKYWLWPSRAFSLSDAPTPPPPDPAPSAQPASRPSHQTDPVDREALRERLRDMTDAELRRFAQGAHNLRSSSTHRGEPAWNLSAIQLEECQAEWRKRRSHS